MSRMGSKNAAVSPVIGVILILAITVMIAAMVASMSTGYLQHLSNPELAGTLINLEDYQQGGSNIKIISITYVAPHSFSQGSTDSEFRLRFLVTTPDGYQYQPVHSSTFDSGSGFIEPGQIYYIIHSNPEKFLVTNDLSAEKLSTNTHQDLSLLGTGTYTVIVVNDVEHSLIAKQTIRV